MARPKKTPVFSCLLTSGQYLFGNYQSTTSGAHLVKIHGLDFTIPEASCVWWALGPKAYRDVLVDRRAEVQKTAKELFANYLDEHKEAIREQVRRELQPEDHSVPLPGGTPVQNFDEAPQMSESESREVQQAHDAVSQGRVSMRSLAEHQNTVVMRRDTERKIQQNPPSRTARRSSVQRVDDSVED